MVLGSARLWVEAATRCQQQGGDRRQLYHLTFPIYHEPEADPRLVRPAILASRPPPASSDHAPGTLPGRRLVW